MVWHQRPPPQKRRAPDLAGTGSSAELLREATEPQLRNYHRGGLGATPTGLSEDLDELAHAVRRLAPDRHDPERFHVLKSEISARLRAMARAVEGGAP